MKGIGGGAVYLSPLFDLFNHEIVSHAVSTVNSEEFVLRMLAALPPEALRGALVHNDQGSLYWSNDWVSRCEELLPAPQDQPPRPVGRPRKTV